MLGLNTKINKSFINSHLQEAHPTLPVHLMEREYQDSQSVSHFKKKKKKKFDRIYNYTHLCSRWFPYPKLVPGVNQQVQRRKSASVAWGIPG